MLLKSKSYFLASNQETIIGPMVYDPHNGIYTTAYMADFHWDGFGKVVKQHIWSDTDSGFGIKKETVDHSSCPHGYDLIEEVEILRKPKP